MALLADALTIKLVTEMTLSNPVLGYRVLRVSGVALACGSVLAAWGDGSNDRTPPASAANGSGLTYMMARPTQSASNLAALSFSIRSCRATAISLAVPAMIRLLDRATDWRLALERAGRVRDHSV